MVNSPVISLDSLLVTTRVEVDEMICGKDEKLEDKIKDVGSKE